MSVGGEGAGLAAQVRGDHPICDARPADLTQWRSAALLQQLIVHHQLTDRRPSHHQQLRWSTMTPSSASLKYRLAEKPDVPGKYSYGMFEQPPNEYNLQFCFKNVQK